MADIPRQPEDVETILAEDRFLRSLAWSLLGDGNEVEDAVQHTWLRSLAHPPQKPAALREFLSRILKNRILNLRGGARRRAHHERSAARSEALPSAEEMVEQEELRRRVGEAVIALEEPYRTTIWLRFREELPPREVAVRMDVPVSTVRTRVRRALEQMRSRLDGNYGDRKAWTGLVVPCLERMELAAAAAVTVVGAMTMKKIVAASAATLLMLMAGLGGLWILGGPQTAPVQPAADAMAGLLPEARAESSRTSVGLPDEEDPVSPLHGFLVHADGSPAVGVPFWTWGARRPPWTRVPEEPRFVNKPLPLGEPAGETDESGSWKLQDEAELEAVTFSPFDLILVSYELEQSPEEPAESVSWELPPFALSRFQVSGLRPDDIWRAQLRPAIFRGFHYDAHGDVLVGYEGGNGRIAAVSLRAGDTGTRTGSASEASFPTIPGQGYIRMVSGIGFEVDPVESEIIAPVAESVQIVSRGPVLRIRVMEPGGSAIARKNGQTAYWKDGRIGGNYRKWIVEDGRADVQWGVFPIDVRYQIRILMEDGEQFASEFTFEPGETERILTFERGQGLLPFLSIELPEGAEIDGCSVVFEDRGGRLVAAKHFEDQFRTNLGTQTGATFTEQGSHGLLLTGFPADWVQLWVLTTEGRVANLRNPGAAAEVRASWLPDTELEAVDLAEPIAGHRSPPGEGFSFLLELVSISGRARMHSVDSFSSTRDTWDWPVWRKRAPIGMRYRVSTWGARGERLEFDLQRR